MTTERVTFERNIHLRVYPRGPRVRASVVSNPRYVMRFGSRMATTLLLLELGAQRRMDEFDADWYQAEFLYRLRLRLMELDWFDAHRQSVFDYDCLQFQYETIDIGVLLDIGKRDYTKLLLDILRTLFDEEGLGSEITISVRRTFRLPPF
jgi:hypothetical protein